MGYEYYLYKSENKEYFELGKGSYSKPLEEFAHWDLNPDIHTTNADYIKFSRHTFNREMMAKTKEEFCQLYEEGLKGTHDEPENQEDRDYIKEVAEKIWDWIKEENVLIYGDHFFDSEYTGVDYFESKKTGTRYREK